jgi:DNA mismatch repair ATPase MutS
MNDTLRNALLENALNRTANVVNKVRSALRAIELDIEANDGIYPYNGGRLTQAEVCRRAGIHKVTLHGPAHIETTRKSISEWLTATKRSLITGKRVVRKQVTERADSWRERYIKAAQWVDHYHREDVVRQARIFELEAENARLRAECIELRAELSRGKVVCLPPP